MKRFLSISLLLFMALPVLAKLWICIDFQFNQDLIAKTLCEQKQNTNNSCQGHCQLNKQLKKTHQQQADHKKTLEELLQIIGILGVQLLQLPQRLCCGYLVFYHGYSPKTLQEYHYAVFWPPKS